VIQDTSRLSARSTPATLRARSTAVSGKVRAKSTFGVLWDVILRSAPALRIVTVDLSSRPMKRPTWTSTSVTAKATPATVITKRSLSWSRFLRASETMALGLLRIGDEPANPVLDHLIDEVGRGRPVGPLLGRPRDPPRVDAPARAPALHGVEQRAERAPARVVRRVRLVLVVRGHEHEPEVVRVVDREADVGAPELPDRLDR